MKSPFLFSLEEKTIIITGALGLLGKHFTQAFLEAGAIVHMVDIIDKATASETIRDFFTADTIKNLHYHETDITNKKQLIALKETILQTNKNIDVFVNNAALNPQVKKNQASPRAQTFEDFPIEQWQKEIDVNLTGTMLCSQVFGAVMSSGSSIINVSSIYGVVAPDPDMYPAGFLKSPAYGVTKAGVINLTKYLAAYWGSRNIRVNCVVLGGVEYDQPTEFIERYSQRTLLKRMAVPSDYLGIMIYLASNASLYSTGAIYCIDGGWTSL